VCLPGAPALDHMPRSEVPCSFIVGNDLAAFHDHLATIDSIMFVATGGDPKLLVLLFDACPGIRWVHSLFAGVDVLSPFIKQRLLTSSVPLTNGRGAYSESLAEYVIAVALYFNKHIPACQANRANKRWDKFVMPVLRGKTIGFVGYGHIGQTCARLAKAFGMRVLALRSDPGKESWLGNLTRSSGVGPFADAVYGLVARLFREADFVVSVLPGTPDTVDCCGRAEFATMKEDSVFISVGRGSVVDEVEPLPEDSPLWDCQNLLLTAHNADFTEDYFSLGWSIWRENFDACSSGRPLVTLVDKSAGY